MVSAWRAAVIELADTEYPDIDAPVEGLHAHPAESAEPLFGDLGYWQRESRAVFSGLIAKTANDVTSQLRDPDMLGFGVPRTRRNAACSQDSAHVPGTAERFGSALTITSTFRTLASPQTGLTPAGHRELALTTS